MNLEIISPEKILFQGEVEVITLPGESGSFTILNDQAPIISVLNKGVISYGTMSDREEIAIDSGFVEAKHNNVTICVE